MRVRSLKELRRISMVSMDTNRRRPRSGIVIMSALIGHAKAARILGNALLDEATEMNGKGHGRESLILACIASAHLQAANRMEQAMREEATGREDVP